MYYVRRDISLLYSLKSIFCLSGIASQLILQLILMYISPLRFIRISQIEMLRVEILYLYLYIYNC